MEAIYLIPIGKVKEEDLLSYLSSQIKKIFPFSVKIGKALPHPDYAYNIKRNQYNSDLILMELQKLNLQRVKKILGIADLDLYTPNLNFVFGQALIGGKVALFALPRLRQSFYGLPEDKSLFYSRCLKEAVHELGHAFGLSHCRSKGCAMVFSNSLADTDQKESRFCDYCIKKLPFPLKGK